MIIACRLQHQHAHRLACLLGGCGERLPAAGPTACGGAKQGCAQYRATPVPQTRAPRGGPATVRRGWGEGGEACQCGVVSGAHRCGARAHCTACAWRPRRAPGGAEQPAQKPTAGRAAHQRQNKQHRSSTRSTGHGEGDFFLAPAGTGGTGAQLSKPLCACALRRCPRALIPRSSPMSVRAAVLVAAAAALLALDGARADGTCPRLPPAPPACCAHAALRQPPNSCLARLQAITRARWRRHRHRKPRDGTARGTARHLAGHSARAPSTGSLARRRRRPTAKPATRARATPPAAAVCLRCAAARLLHTPLAVHAGRHAGKPGVPGPTAHPAGHAPPRVPRSSLPPLTPRSPTPTLLLNSAVFIAHEEAGFCNQVVFQSIDAAECQDACIADAECASYTTVDGNCFFATSDCCSTSVFVENAQSFFQPSRCCMLHRGESGCGRGGVASHPWPPCPLLKGHATPLRKASSWTAKTRPGRTAPWTLSASGSQARAAAAR